MNYDKWNEYFLIATALRQKIDEDIRFTNKWMQDHEEVLEGIEGNIDNCFELMHTYAQKADQESPALRGDHEPLLYGEYWQKCIETYYNHKSYVHEIRQRKNERSANTKA